MDNWFIRFIKWFAGFFEDTTGSASSKRGIVWIFVVMYMQQVQASLRGVSINETVFYGTLAAIFAILGLTMPEWFSPKGSMLQGAKIEKITETKSETSTTKTT